ncbi:MAG: AtpZ/AtpI family protein [Candidatus Paceibacterota bacterium]|jgi:F0F1-type ATP synthase assembly protein I
MENNKTKELWWRPAMMMFANVSGWIAGPIIIALIVGKYLDKKYNSDPWFFLGLTAIAFFISIFSIVKIMMKYIKEIEKEAKEKKVLLENQENK